MKVLISGFEPFGKMKINPSEEILRKLQSEISGAEIHSILLPVTYDGAFEVLKERIDELKPDAIISLGIAQGRVGITPERIAINVNSCSLPDNNNICLEDEFIYDDSELAYLSTLPIRSILNNLRDQGIKSYISNSAGTYICNNIMYKVLEYVKDESLTGFIHIPLMEGMKNEKGFYTMTLEDMVKAIEISIETTVEYLGGLK